MELTKELLYELYINQRMSMRTMATELKVGRQRISAKLKEYGFTKEMQDRSLEFNILHNDLMIGSVLGDGTFPFQGTNYNFSCRHAENQKGYLQMKYNLLSHLCSMPNINSNDWNAQHSDNAQIMWYFNTKAYVMFNKYGNMNITEAVSELNNNSLAIWLMDDGYLKVKAHYTPHYTLSIKRFTTEELEYTIKLLNERFDLNPKINSYEHNTYVASSLYFPVADTPKIKAILESSDFYDELKECMAYKIIQN